jgi:hypothetical protein
VPSLTAVKLTRTQNISSNLKDNIIVSSGQATFKIKAEESGIGYMMGDLITNEKTRPGNIRVNITDSLIPTTGLNVLYLNYFGDDRGNQRGYFSENNKYIENLMKSSNKLLATTTQLVDESKVKELLRAIDPDFQVKNY